jgi:hypothetical protein
MVNDASIAKWYYSDAFTAHEGINNQYGQQEISKGKKKLAISKATTANYITIRLIWQGLCIAPQLYLRCKVSLTDIRLLL